MSALSKISAAIAVTLATLERFEQAEFFFNKAEETHKRILARSDHFYLRHRYVVFLRNKAFFRRSTGHVDDAVALLNKAIGILDDVLKMDGVVEMADYMSELYLKRSELLKMKGQLDDAESDRTEAQFFRTHTSESG